MNLNETVTTSLLEDVEGQQYVQELFQFVIKTYMYKIKIYKTIIFAVFFKGVKLDLLRGGADKSLARPTSRCRRTE